MPSLQSRCNILKDVEVVDIDNQPSHQDNIMMLGTIRVPKNLRLLSERLPKSNYGSVQRKKDPSKLDKALTQIDSSELLAQALPPRC
jgi:hypothetical protein